MRMKTIIASILILFAVSMTIAANNQTLQDTAKVAFDEGQYGKAIDLYEKELKSYKDKGLESADLYYNLGNAYFRSNDLAHARLNYERALLLDPGDRDVRHNIEYLTTKIEDKIVDSGTFFLANWFRAIQNLFTSNTWAMLGIAAFIALIVCLVFFFFTQNVLLKKVAFYKGIVLMLVVIFANVFAFNQKAKLEVRNTAVVMLSSVSVVGSPDSSGKEVFVLHAGTKVHITKKDHNWLEIEIDNGAVGWIKREAIEII